MRYLLLIFTSFMFVNATQAADPHKIRPAVCSLVSQEVCERLDDLSAADRNKLNISASYCFRQIDHENCRRKLGYLFNTGQPAMDVFLARVCETGFEPACAYLSQK